MIRKINKWINRVLFQRVRCDCGQWARRIQCTGGVGDVCACGRVSVRFDEAPPPGVAVVNGRTYSKGLWDKVLPRKVCSNCKWWDETDFWYPPAKGAPRTGHCDHQELNRRGHVRVDNGFSVDDGYQLGQAFLKTGEQFGCVKHELEEDHGRDD